MRLPRFVLALIEEKYCYLIDTVPLERLYTKIGVPIKRYPPRGLSQSYRANSSVKIEPEAGEVEPPLCLHYSEISQKARSLKRTYAQAGE